MAEIVAIKRGEAEGPLVVREAGAVLHLTLAQAPANALSRDMIARLQDAIAHAAAAERLRVIVLGSRGPTFCAGHDLKELTARRADADGGARFFAETFEACAALMLSVQNSPKPVIAAVDGLATAAGLQLVAACDLAIASTEATFCTPGVNIGLFCASPAVTLSRSVPRKAAMEMLLTGETIDATAARDWGLVNRVVPREYLGQVVGKYAQTLAAKAPAVLRDGRAAFNAQAGMSLEDAYAFSARAMADAMLAPEAQEGIGAFLAKREPRWGET